MGIIVRQSLKTVVATYFGISFGVLNTLLLYPLVLTEEQVGLTRTMINAGLLLATFASFGAANMPMLFFPFFKDQSKQHHGILFFLLTVGTIGIAVFCLAFFGLKSVLVSTYIEKAPLFLEYVYYLIPLTAVLVYWNIFESYSIVNQLPVVPALVREVGVRGLLAVGLILLYTQYFSFDWYVRSIVLTYVFALVATLLYLKSKNILFLKPSRSFFAHHRINDMMVYGGFVLMGNASGAIIANIDGLMVSAYSGLKSTGVYTIAFFIAQVVEIPKRSLSQVLVPLVSEANKNNDIPKLRELYKKSSINQLIMGGSIFLCVWCNIENIFQLIPNGHLYVAGKWVVFYIGLAKLFDMATGINSEIIGTSKYYKFDLVFYIFLSIVGIVANVILIPLLGITGAAIASAISVFLFNTARFIFIAKLFTMQPFSFSTVVVIMLGVAVIVGNVFMPEIGYPLINIFVRSILILSVFLGGAVFFNTSDEINDIMSKVRIRIKMVLGSR